VNGSQAWIEKDFYKVLGVEEKATEDQIRRAYRKLAQKHHPDRNPGDKRAEERMKEISEAYDVLSDSSKREQYDAMRRMGANGFAGGYGQGNFNIRVEDLGDLGGIFSTMFGGGGPRARRSAPRGEDRTAEAHLSFEDAMRGATISVNLPGEAPCATCGGSGAEPGSAVSTCPVCTGSGVVEEDQGFFSIPRACDRCGGSGRIVEKPCRTCHGTGRQATSDTVRVRIPAGVRDGARIRVRGKGGSRGGAPGDLYVVVRVAPHASFGRRDDDLTLTLPVSFTAAALGAQVKVPTLDGSVTLKIPPGTQGGRTFRVRGKGAPRAKAGGYGDLLVTVTIIVPTEVTEEQRELLEKLAATEGHEAHAGMEV
jgi:molecular chaperone DnaJ